MTVTQTVREPALALIGEDPPTSVIRQASCRSCFWPMPAHLLTEGTCPECREA